MSSYEIGDAVFHMKLGLGKVYSLPHFENGREVVNINFDGEIKLLAIQHANLQKVTNQFPEQLNQQFQDWLSGLFLTENINQMHFKSGRWQPFFENMFFFDTETVREDLTKFLPNAKLFSGHYNFFTLASSLVNYAPISYQLNSPNHEMGLSLVLDSKPEGNKLHTLFPFYADGVEVELNLESVFVFENGLEAQITCNWKGLKICFYDTRFIHNRSRYLNGELHDFELTGIAYVAWTTVSQHVTFEAIEAVNRDDYQFSGNVKALEPFNDYLGQSGWIATVTVMKTLNDDLDQDLKIVITQRVWQGEQAPVIESYIEGKLWLQGYLWNVTNKQHF